MKKALVLGVALALSPMAVRAQSDIATVNATATILANLTVASVTDLDFGSLTAGTGVIVPLGAGAPPAGTTRGEVQIDHNSDVQVTLSGGVPAALSGPGGLIPVSFTCGYSTTSGGAAAPEPSCDALPNTGILLPGVDQSTFLQIAGTILGANTNVTAGNYSTSMTFNVLAVY